MEKSIKRYMILFTFPTLLAFAVVFLIPFVMGIYLSFTKFTTVNDAVWVGFGNYAKAFASDDFLNALWFTAKFTVVTSIAVNVSAFVLALLLTRGIRGTSLFRTAFFMPNLIGGIVLGYIWQLILNGILLRFEVTLTFSAKYGFWGLVVLMSWQLIGYMMVIYIAGIQSIPKDLLEVARIEGASRMQSVRHVTIPIIMPAITICTFLTMTNSLKMFDQNLALTAGAPAKQTAMLALDIFNTFYGTPGWEGVGQAKAVVFFALVAVIAAVQLAITRSREVEQ
ncbi:carbohydrate ABC transporter permease [Paenibacillaceae bacterium WGS1546]|uniref:carbohydrate ABC transporter permease n=1 Tax=Cohnella sp. WGS1546 TaxID=3366810 RepID=UPI00372D7ED7